MTQRGPVQQLIAKGRASVRARVKRDEKRVARRRESSDQDPVRLAAVAEILEHIRKHLHEPELNVAHIERSVYINCWIRRRFREETGFKISGYLTALKRQLAEWLLIHTALPVKAIAEEALRYTTESNFSRDFKKWTGNTPSDFRKAAKAAREGERDPELSKIGIRWRASVGLLPPEQMKRFVEDLERRLQLPEGASVRPPPAVVFRGELHGEIQAQIVWNRIRGEPPERQLEILRTECAFESAALLDFLSEKGLEAGRRNRQDGIRIAKLALASVVGSAPYLGQRSPLLHALALARLGNAHRLAGDFPEAQRSIAEARKTAAKTYHLSDPRVEWEIELYEGALRLAQRRFEESLRFANVTISLFQQHRDQSLLAKSLLLRYDIRYHQGLLGDATQDLRRAEDILSQLNEPLHLLGVQQNLVAVHLEMGELDEANNILARAKELCHALDHEAIKNQLLWSEGRILLGLDKPDSAETTWKKALDGFDKLGDMNASVDLGLELASLYQDRGRSHDAVELIMNRTIPALQALGVTREDFAVIELLQGAVASSSFSRSVLRKARESLGRESRTGLRPALAMGMPT